LSSIHSKVIWEESIHVFHRKHLPKYFCIH
jgi:hypothetical protein